MKILFKLLIKIYRLLLKIPYSIYKRFRTYPNPKFDKQQYNMVTGNDCENIAIMNAIPEITYSQAEDALLRLPLGWFQNPIYGNPWNMKEALRELGLNFEEINCEDIKKEDIIILLLHDPESILNHIMYKHWIAKPANRQTWDYGDNTEPEYLASDFIKKISDCRFFKCILKIKSK